MHPSSQPGPSHRKHQRPAERFSKCIKYIKSSDGSGFRSFAEFVTGLFTEFPTDRSSGTDSDHQTVTQTVKAFLKWTPLNAFFDKVSLHSLMAKGENTQGIVPSHCISPGIPLSDGMAPLLWEHTQLI